jgi:heat shock protein HslJ
VFNPVEIETVVEKEPNHMNQNHVLSSIAIVLVILALSACSGSPTAAPSPTAGADPLAGTQWTLVSYGAPGQEEPALPGAQVTLAFEANGQAGGNAGCNSYGGSYQVQGDTIAFGEIASTLMACADAAVGAQETDFLQALGTAERFEMGDRRLAIFYSNGAQVLNFQAAGE